MSKSAPAAREDRLLALTVGAVGVVYGDIGTSPLYTLKECFGEHVGLAPTTENVLGILSLVFWSLILVITVKYVGVVMRADNRGEGGILSLLALTQRALTVGGRSRKLVAVLGLIGAALFYGDSAITPAISVLGAVEGLEIAAPEIEEYVVPIALALLVPLFLFQKHGTARVGSLFGPIMLLWFGTIGTLGLLQIIQAPWILGAVDPRHAVVFFFDNAMIGFLALGAVVLAVTGGEALYADMGHFGRRPIRLAWVFIVLPSLLLNYFGQGALIATDPETLRNPFYLLAPEWALYPMVALSTAAAVIASQAVISGAYSLTRQAVLLGYWPRLAIRHTSEHEVGQVYVPEANWTLLAAVVALVVGFQSSSALAAAYGIAVTGTMACTTVLAFFAVRKLWNWSTPLAAAVFGFFLITDMAFLGANIHKLPEGGWFPVALGAVIFTLMTTWRRGREIVLARIREGELSVNAFLDRLKPDQPLRVPGTAIFLTATRDAVPTALLHNLKHNKVLHERVFFLTVVTEDVPAVSPGQRIEVVELGKNFWRVIVRFGFMQEPNVPRALAQCAAQGLEIKMLETSFFLGRETLVPAVRPVMPRWREKLFIAMSHLAVSATEFFRIPTNRVVELGSQVEV